MSTAAKTTPSVRLKLKEAQEEIGALRLALAKKNSPTNTIDSPEDTPEDPEDASTTKPMYNGTVADAKSLGSALIDHITEAQAIGSALAGKYRDTTHEDSDAMEEDEAPSIHIGSFTSSDTSSTANKEQHNREPDKQPVIELSSNNTSSSSDSSSSSSSSSSDDSSDNESSDSQNTQELAARIRKNNKQRQYTTPPKNQANLEEPNGAHRGPTDSQAIELSSGPRGAHLPTLNPSGGAGDPSRDAGHSE
jgi:hypothetical protein